MADVFLAVIAGPVGSGFSKLTVVKRLRANLAEDPEFVSMLVDEARIAARLNHPNVVQTNEVGQFDNEYFIAMEYLDGQPLHRIQHRAARALVQGGKQVLPPELQYVVLVDMLAGLHHAHELADYDGSPLEIVHRDVTPHNVFVTYEGQVKVVDFGIAKAAGRMSETRQGVVKGKVRYMAPEQAVGQPVDRRADVFSAGVMLWEVATGRRLWSQADDMRIVHCLIAGEIRSSPREVNPEVPEGIDRICRKALAAAVDERYPTAEAFRNDLEQYLAEAGLLVEARRKLGSVVAALFADKRKELKAVIESQLSNLDDRATMPGVAALSDASGPISRGMFSPPPRSLSSASHSIDSPVDVVQTVEQQRQPRGLTGLILGGALAVTLGGVATWLASTRTAEPARETKSEVVQVSFEAQPSTARILFDERDLGSSFHGVMPLDRNIHRVRVEAEGFVTREESVSLEADLRREFTLKPVDAAAKASPPSEPVVKPAVVGKTSAVIVRQHVPAAAASSAVSVTSAAPAVTQKTSASTVQNPVDAPLPAPSGKPRRELDKSDPYGQ